VENKHILAVHFQFMDSEEAAKRLFGAKKRFIASFVPDLADKCLRTEGREEIYGRIHPTDNFYPDWAMRLFSENGPNPYVTWVQEGYRHCCERCFNRREENIRTGGGDFPDPYHEHVCLDGHNQSLEKQMEVMQKGRRIIQELGIEPVGYCPPNHLYNKDTKSAARILDFKYFLTRNGFDYFFPGLVEFPAYFDDELTVVPESKLERTKSPVIMVYYSDITEGKVPDWQELLQSSEPVSPLGIAEELKTKIWMNERLILLYKKLRDFKERI
jgi:hypothetical protein